MGGTITIVSCQVCGKLHDVKPHKLKIGEGKYCSRECYYKSEKNKVERICPICGKKFETWPSLIKEGKGIYDSKECAGKAQQNRTVPVTCAVCGKVKYYPPAKAKTVKYCCKECMKVAQKRKVKRICKQCGIEFEANPGEIKKGGAYFHNRDCWNDYHRGRNCHTWRGGKSFGKYCPKFNTRLKKKVRSFFGYKCVLCGKTEKELGRKLDVHHVDYEKEDCCNGNRDPLFVPLCRNCHARTTNGDREEWELFFRYYLALGYNNKCY